MFFKIKVVRSLMKLFVVVSPFKENLPFATCNSQSMIIKLQSELYFIKKNPPKKGSYFRMICQSSKFLARSEYFGLVISRIFEF